MSVLCTATMACVADSLVENLEIAGKEDLKSFVGKHVSDVALLLRWEEKTKSTGSNARCSISSLPVT